MTQFIRALVAMDLSEMDANLLRFTRLLAGSLETEKIYFLHVMPDFSVPKEVDIEFHKLFAPEYPVDEKVRDKMALDVQEFFNDAAGMEFEVDVREGKPYEKLIHWAQIKEIDLLVVGHKAESEGSGITPRRVARKTDCNVLFVPDRIAEDIRNIIVPVDFSENAYRALDTALRLKRQLPDAGVRCLYIVEMPPVDYFHRPFDNTGYVEILRKSALNAYHNFLKEYRIEPSELAEIQMINNDYGNVAAHINEYVDQQPADLVIMGAQGHSAIENLIFGSITERFVEQNLSRPVLIVR